MSDTTAPVQTLESNEAGASDISLAIGTYRFEGSGFVSLAIVTITPGGNVGRVYPRGDSPHWVERQEPPEREELSPVTLDRSGEFEVTDPSVVYRVTRGRGVLSLFRLA